MSRHINIPVFIPHLGCPNQCVFCNQRTISGTERFDIDDVRRTIDTALTTVARGDECEIAFFGGSFTGIDRELILRLLSISDEYYERDDIRSVRCSTRPDYIDEEIIEILKQHHVMTVELGLQSTDDAVLSVTRRGHSFAQEERACRLIKSSGINLVGQMMIGLPGATLESELETARFIVRSGAVAARIYPTVVFKETPLCDMSRDGKYEPLTVEEAVERSARVLEIFVSSGVKVIRIGLCASENLSSEDKYFAGPNHPALGEMVESRAYYYRILREIERLGLTGCGNITIAVPRGALSKAIGQRKANKRLLAQRCGIEPKWLHFVEDSDLDEYSVAVKGADATDMRGTKEERQVKENRQAKERKEDRCI